MSSLPERTVVSHDLLKILEFAYTHDPFTWTELNEALPDVKKEWYLSGSRVANEILIETGSNLDKKPLHRISPYGLSIYLSHANLMEVQKTSKRAERIARVAILVAIISVIIQIIVSVIELYG